MITAFHNVAITRPRHDTIPVGLPALAGNGLARRRPTRPAGGDDLNNAEAKRRTTQSAIEALRERLPRLSLLSRRIAGDLDRSYLLHRRAAVHPSVLHCAMPGAGDKRESKAVPNSKMLQKTTEWMVRQYAHRTRRISALAIRDTVRICCHCSGQQKARIFGPTGKAAVDSAAFPVIVRPRGLETVSWFPPQGGRNGLHVGWAPGFPNNVVVVPASGRREAPGLTRWR